MEFLSSRYRENMKDLMRQVMFFRTVLENPTTAAYKTWEHEGLSLFLDSRLELW